MPEYLVELTSANPRDPKHVTIKAASPERALLLALQVEGVRSLLRAYDKQTDPGESYRGWSYVTISIDCDPEGVREFEQKHIPGYETIHIKKTRDSVLCGQNILGLLTDAEKGSEAVDCPECLEARE
jgi:hypothetical protein